MRARVTERGDAAEVRLSNKYTLMTHKGVHVIVDLYESCFETKLNRYLWVWDLPQQLKDKKRT